MWHKFFRKGLISGSRIVMRVRSDRSRRLSVEPLEERRLLAITVDTLVDENDGIGVGDVSLRDAIAAATSGETVDFAVAGTISLEHGQLEVDKDLVIDGPGAGDLIIDAGTNSRVFDVNDLQANLLDVSISGLELRGGDAFLIGGGIRTVENLTVDSMRFVENASGSAGGAIYSDLGDLDVINSEFIDNTAGSGGAISVHADSAMNVTITDSVFTGNKADDSIDIDGLVSGSGGAIDIRASDSNAVIEITGSEFYGNRAADGGAVAVEGIGESVTVSHCKIGSDEDQELGNTATRFGGGLLISCDQTEITVQHTNIAGNTSLYEGGGIFVAGGGLDFADRIHTFDFPSRPGNVLLQNLKVHHNRAIRTGDALEFDHSAGHGGGIFAAMGQNADEDNEAEFIIDRSSVYENSATGNGGGVFFWALAHADAEQVIGTHITNSTIFDNTAYGDIPNDIDIDPHDGGGGGIYCRVSENFFGEFEPTATITNTTVSGNRALSGGGIQLQGPVQLNHSTIAFNTIGPFVGDSDAPERSALEQATVGGGVYVRSIGNEEYGEPSFNHTIIANNIHLLDDGEEGDPRIGMGSNTPFPEDNYSPDFGARVFEDGVLGFASNFHSELPFSPPLRTITFDYTIVGDIAGPLHPSQNIIQPIGNGINELFEIDSLLDSNLADNGGSTLTHTLLSGSPAIDVGDPTAVPGVGAMPLYDQRGNPFTRVFDTPAVDNGPAGEINVIDIGALEVQPIQEEPCPIGDYNENGIVDAADYTVWRDRLGQTFSLPNEDPTVTPGEVTFEDYQVWKDHFGEVCEECAAGEGYGQVIVDDKAFDQSHQFAGASVGTSAVETERTIPDLAWKSSLALDHSQDGYGEAIRSFDSHRELPWITASARMRLDRSLLIDLSMLASNTPESYVELTESAALKPGSRESLTAFELAIEEYFGDGEWRNLANALKA